MAPQKTTKYLALACELWGVFCEYLWEYWPRYKAPHCIHVFDLGGDDQAELADHPKIRILINFCISGPNLVILAWTGGELSHGQALVDSHTYTHKRTNEGNGNTWRLKLASGKNHTKFIATLIWWNITVIIIISYVQCTIYSEIQFFHNFIRLDQPLH